MCICMFASEKLTWKCIGACQKQVIDFLLDLYVIMKYEALLNGKIMDFQ